MARKDTKRYSARELIRMRERGDYIPARKDTPVIEPNAAFWENARIVLPPPGKASVHLRVDSDVLEWFKAQGKGHLTRMNAVLRSYVEAKKQEHGRER